MQKYSLPDHKTQTAVLTYKLRTGKVKNPGPVKAKIKKLKEKAAHNAWLAK